MADERLSIHSDNSELDNYKAIIQVVESVEWDQVHKCMEFLDWTWASTDRGFAVPTIQELIQHAKSRSEDAVKKCIDNKIGYYTSCGGIDVRAEYFDEGSVGLNVLFVLSDSDNYL